MTLDEEYVALNWKWGVDEKSQEKTEVAANNMISLLADVAIISKVAGEALNKLWSGIKDSVSVSIGELDDINVGLVAGIAPEDILALKYAVGQIGGTDKQANSMVDELYKLSRSLLAPETGSDAMEGFYETMGKAGVNDETKKNIIDALKNKDLIEAMKLLGETRNEVGDKFPKLMSDLNLEGLRNLSIDKQYDEWVEAWSKSTSILNNIDYEGVDDLSDAIKNFKKALSAIKLDFAGDIGRDLKDLSEAILSMTEHFLQWKKNLLTDPNTKSMESAQQNMFSLDQGLGEDSTVGERADQFFGNFADYITGLAGLITGEDYTVEGGAQTLTEGLRSWNSGEVFNKDQGAAGGIEGSSTGDTINLNDVTIVANDPEQLVSELETFNRHMRHIIP